MEQWEYRDTLQRQTGATLRILLATILTDSVVACQAIQTLLLCRKAGVTGTNQLALYSGRLLLYTAVVSYRSVQWQCCSGTAAAPAAPFLVHVQHPMAKI